MNEQLINFKQNPNSIDFNVLLKLYKYLTLIQKLIDNPILSVDTSINAKINKLLPNFILGISLIITSFIGKNIQRIVWVYSFDKQEHTWQDYSDEIFFNSENHLTTIIDTFLTTFFISATANWSRNVIWDIIKDLICCNKGKKK